QDSVRLLVAVALVCVVGCADEVEVVRGSPATSSAVAGTGGFDPGIGGQGGGHASSSHAMSSSTGSDQDCTPTCSGLGTDACSCSRPCGDFENKPEWISCQPSVDGAKVECLCVIEGVVAGICYETD